MNIYSHYSSWQWFSCSLIRLHSFIICILSRICFALFSSPKDVSFLKKKNHFFGPLELRHIRNRAACFGCWSEISEWVLSARMLPWVIKRNGCLTCPVSDIQTGLFSACLRLHLLGQRHPHTAPVYLPVLFYGICLYDANGRTLFAYFGMVISKLKMKLELQKKMLKN